MLTRQSQKSREHTTKQDFVWGREGMFPPEAQCGAPLTRLDRPLGVLEGSAQTAHGPATCVHTHSRTCMAARVPACEFTRTGTHACTRTLTYMCTRLHVFHTGTCVHAHTCSHVPHMDAHARVHTLTRITRYSWSAGRQAPGMGVTPVGKALPAPVALHRCPGFCGPGAGS